MAKVLIADDHEIFRLGIKQIIREMSDKIEIHEAGNGREVIEKISEFDYDIVLLDISMPGRSGLDILKQIRGYKPACKILMLSMYPEKQFAVRALKSGAAGYLSKSCSPDELVSAIQKLLIGKKYISSSLADKLAFYIETDEGEALHESLSTREYEVLCLTAEGKPVKQIAMELSLSDKTISTYRARIMDKLNISNVAQLIKYAINNNILA